LLEKGKAKKVSFMGKNKRSRDVLEAIRRNTGYATGRAFGLVTSVVTVVVCAGLGALLGTDREQEIVLAFILMGALGGVVPALLLNHLANAIFDGADSLVQIAKFQERSLRRRNDALDLVEKIREEVEADEENPDPGKTDEGLSEVPPETKDNEEELPANEEAS
tara:strand:- start:40 stop:531 length:492 start_codon:yes stop_codon:yes gene_type:complete